MLKPVLINLGAAMIAGAALFTPGGAHAQTAKVHYYAAELQTAAGTEAVLKRIRRIASQACRDDNSNFPFASPDCQSELVDQIVDRIGDPRMLALRNDGHRSVQLASRK